MSEELKPCPFCGHVGLNFQEGETFRWLAYSCCGCGIGSEVRVQTLGGGNPKQWREEAEIRAAVEWNTRSTPMAGAEPPKQGEAMPRLEFIGLPPGDMVPFGSFDADGETPATVVFKFCAAPSVEPAKPIPFKVETWPLDADGVEANLCTECGTPVRYGSRHSKCGQKVMDAERAAEAIQPPAPHQEPGWVRVPVEPTDEMEIAAENAYEISGGYFPRWKTAYRAMLAAAPKEPKP